MYSILDGDFAVVFEQEDGDGKRQFIEVARLSQGEIIGEAALINEKPRSATVTCRSKRGDVIEVKSQQFKELLKTSPDIFEAIAALSRERSYELTRTATNSATRTQNSKDHQEGNMPGRHETES